MASKQVTLRDISQKCGFSVNTISRALRNDPRISDRTKGIITQIASDTGYIKNLSALTLSSGRSHTIATIVNNVQNPHFSNMLGLIEKQLRVAGYDTIIFCIQNDRSLGLQTVKSAISRSVDGILYFPFQDDLAIDYMEKNHMPFVLLDRWIKGKKVDTVRCDDEQGGFLVGEHLILLGHRRFVYLCGPEINSSHTDRRLGFQQALRIHGIPQENVRYLSMDSVTAAIESKRICELLSPFDYTAIVSFNDEMAYHALNDLPKRGIRVPEDVSIIGFDHLKGMIPYLPALTSVSTLNESVANCAVKCLLNRINNPRAETQIRVLPVCIYDEGTTAPPRDL